MEDFNLEEIEQDNDEFVMTWAMAMVLIFGLVMLCFAVIGINCVLRGH